MRESGIVEQLQRLSQWIVRATRARTSGDERVLFVSPEEHGGLERLCRRSQWELNAAAGLPLALKTLRGRRFDVVIYDQDMPGQDWRVAVASLAAAAPSSSILLLSPRGHPELWNEVIRRGGHDVLSKQASDEGVESAVALAMARAKSSQGRRKTSVA